MKNREQYKRLLRMVASTVIVVLQTAMFAYVWHNCYAGPGANQFVRGNYVIIAQYALMVVCAFKLYGGFKIGQLRAFEVLYSQILSVLCVNLLTYLQLCLICRWKFLTNLEPMLWMTAADVAVELVWVVLTRWVYAKLYPPRKLLMVYGDYSPDLLIRKFDFRADKYSIEEAVCVNEGEERVRERILAYGSVILMDIPAQIRNELLKFCYVENIRCYCVPKISDIMLMSGEKIHLFDTTLMLFRNMGLTAEQRFLKRAFDILFSLLACVVASPIMLIVAAAIKLTDGGPVFFTQDRLTKDGKVFRLYKFRSMRVEREERAYCMTRKNDDRITPVGRLLRRLHLDELPQIFNILKGEMSFVGPRPECPALAEEYSANFPEFRYRLKVKAGLTGYAQVYGKYNTTPYDKLKLDLTYIENYSFLLDIKLILLTFKVVFRRETSEGIEDWQSNAAPEEPVSAGRGK